MNLKEECSNTFVIIGEVLSSRKYKLIASLVGIAIFGVLYYFLVAKVADNSIWISVMMSGTAFITFSVASIIVTAVLSGILMSMIFFKFENYRKMEGRGIVGFIGSGVAAFGVGCPTCGAFLFGLVGMPLALMYFPFRGLEIQVLGIFILMVSIYLTGKSVEGACRIK